MEREIERLETHLERKERELQYVVDHYERLLSEKDRQLANERRAESTRTTGTTLRSMLGRWL